MLHPLIAAFIDRGYADIHIARFIDRPGAAIASMFPVRMAGTTLHLHGAVFQRNAAVVLFNHQRLNTSSPPDWADRRGAGKVFDGDVVLFLPSQKIYRQNTMMGSRYSSRRRLHER